MHTLIIGGRVQGNGTFQLSFTGPIGQTYNVLATDDLTVSLVNWIVLGSGTFGNTDVLFTDYDSTNHLSRFYSVKSP